MLDVVEKTEDERVQERANELFKEYKTETEKRQISSSENFDKSILTYASWALGISIAFLKDFIPIDVANMPYLLYISWFLFFVSIGLTTTSFLVSYKSLGLNLEFAHKYYIERNEEYLNRKNIFTVVVEWFNRISGFSFILGLIFTVVFASSNLEKAAMEKKMQRGIAQDGMPPSLMTKIMPTGDLNKGLTPSSMTKLPSTAPAPAPAPAPQSTPASKPAK
ncbi:hypothetical protein [Duganella sp. LjRoot269]|uniref:hypothetical protein n=1 Tax=Duganella sp. LjRoot269 TaxID=3342305 RepID=UPI003ECF2B2A